jgi:hypothetical protein
LVEHRSEGIRRGGCASAFAGIQNVIAGDGIAARLRADDGEGAVERVRDLLAGEPFSVEGAQPE